MSSKYRLEISSTSRASCQNAECKKAGIKITKGELRLGVFVTIQENQSWKWKHWGCTTPQVLQNISDAIEGDLDLFDGYEELPEEDQARVSSAIELGHVADEDWKGDVELNRPGMKGFRTAATKAKKKQEEKEEKERQTNAVEGGDESPAKPPAKKRGRGKKDLADDEDEESEPVSKKVKTAEKRGKKVKEEDEDLAATSEKAKPAAKKKATKVKEEEDDQDLATISKKAKPAGKKGQRVKQEDEVGNDTNDDAKTAAVKTKPRARKAKNAELDEDDDVNDAGEVPVPQKSKRASKATPKANTKAKRTENAGDGVASAPATVSKKTKAATKKVKDNSPHDVEEPGTTKKVTSRGRKKANQGEDAGESAKAAAIGTKNTRGRGQAKKTAGKGEAE